MRKSALSLFISCLSLALALPAQAAGTSGKSTASKRKAAVVSQKSVRAPKAAGKVSAKGGVVSRAVVSNGKQRVSYQRVSLRPRAAASFAPVMTAGDLAGLGATRDPLNLASNVAFVVDQETGEVLFEKNADIALPIASITKLMTGLIVVEAAQDMDEILEVTEEDVDREKGSSSRLRVGARMSRANMLHIALMSSENRAASALGRHYPGGRPAFVAAMNAKARELGMQETRYVDSTGLSSRNVASARDLSKLVAYAYQYPLLRQYSTEPEYQVNASGQPLQYRNSNHLVNNPQWEIGLQKTGYISEAGRCLVMQARVENRPVVMVFLDSKGKLSRTADAGRVKRWLETARPKIVANFSNTTT